MLGKVSSLLVPIVCVILKTMSSIFVCYLGCRGASFDAALVASQPTFTSSLLSIIFHRPERVFALSFVPSLKDLLFLGDPENNETGIHCT